MDYKATLNLPKTSFPMKANLPQAEPKVLARWEEEKLYGKVLARRKGAQPFILHDGPPYANGDIHIGHALNKVLKDLIVRYHTMRGRLAPYVPGWDCHGLPIEYALMKELKLTKHQVDTVEFRRKARAYALKYVGVQREQFKRLGISGDWDHPYLTLEPEYVATALRSLGKLVEKGFIYRARKPVNWCWSCETALAEAEVEYEQHTSPAIFVKFDLTPDAVKKLALPAERDITNVSLIIWTTTPWTLMGNVAVAVHPKLRYAVRAAGMRMDGKRVYEAWITLSKLPAEYAQMLGIHMRNSDEEIVAELDGQQLGGLELEYEHPFGVRKGRVVLADYVSAEEGSGLVHTAPGFGTEDYATGRRYGLEVFAPVDAQGRFTGLPKEVGYLNGLHVQNEANKRITEELEKRDRLIPNLGQSGYKHQYPHCWRCHEPIIFRATDQWFLNVEHENLRTKLQDLVGHEVEWIPAVGRERMAGMVKTRPDWCLSRQRLWGIPIPAVICQKCGEGFLEPAVIESFAAAAEKEEEGSDRWFSEPVEKWLPVGFSCRTKGCGGRKFNKGTDILDVWFDSGVSHQAVLRRRSDLRYPAEMYLEGSDQHRGWFQVSLITGAALEGKAPYRSVLTHGFVVDGEGRKMSKSLGNVIAPQEVISGYGADVLRLWVASSDYAEDVRLSKAILEQAAEAYRKIRNTLRFCLANLSDFDPAQAPAQRPALAEAPPRAPAQSLDRWIVGELGGLVQEVTRAYDAYAFHRVVKAMHEFCTVRLSNFYLDVVKDVLYTAYTKDPRRLSAQRALYEIARTLTLLLAPVLPVTAEEAWAALPQIGEPESVHLQDWPAAEGAGRDPELQQEWVRLLELRDGAMKALEQAREAKQIGDALEAELEVTVGDPKLWEFLNARQEEFQMACLVSGLRLSRGQSATEPVSFRVAKAPGAKCQRCWMRLSSVGQSAEHPGLCGRCVGVLQKLAAEGKL